MTKIKWEKTQSNRKVKQKWKYKQKKIKIY